MRFAAAIILIVMNSGILAATNMPVAVCFTTTNVVSVQALKKTSKSSRPQCEATTLSGNRCKRRATNGSKYCSQHAAIIRKREKDKNEVRQGQTSLPQ